MNNEPTQKKEPTEEDLSTLNYNDRPDGYGFGEAECLDDDKEYEHDAHFTGHCKDMGEGYRCHKNEPYTRDENGQRNQYGPVDQYVFRDNHLVKRNKPKENNKETP